MLSLRGRDAKESIVHQNRLGAQDVASATDPNAFSHVVCDTFLRFKGLERPAVIVTDLRLVKGEYHRRMHIAVSRATTVLRVVAAEDQMKGDKVLAAVL